MKIENDKYVEINYTLKDGSGKVLDSTDGNEPLAFIFGKSSLLPGLEAALEGKIKGNKTNVVIEPEDAYGQRDDSLIQVIEASQFENPNEIEPGMQFSAEDDHGPILLTVLKVDEEGVMVDGNHPLAGITMDFDVEVCEVRDATEEELTPSSSCCGSHGDDGCGSGNCDC